MRFDDVKHEIEAYGHKFRKERGIKSELILIEGFVNETICPEKNKVQIGGTVLPLVLFIEKETGVTHLIAVNAFLKKVENNETNNN